MLPARCPAPRGASWLWCSAARRLPWPCTPSGKPRCSRLLPSWFNSDRSLARAGEDGGAAPVLWVLPYLANKAALCLCRLNSHRLMRKLKSIKSHGGDDPPGMCSGAPCGPPPPGDKGWGRLCSHPASDCAGFSSCSTLSLCRGLFTQISLVIHAGVLQHAAAVHPTGYRMESLFRSVALCPSVCHR